MSEEIEKIPDPEIDNTVTEILPLPLAIEQLAPNCIWSLTGDTLEGLEWNDDINLRPSDQDIIAKAQELKAQKPMKRLRQLRDYRLKEVDWVTLRAIRTGEPIPEEWKGYMQALADITETSEPQLVGGQLVGVEWPERPDGIPAGQPPGLIYR